MLMSSEDRIRVDPSGSSAMSFPFSLISIAVASYSESEAITLMRFPSIFMRDLYSSIIFSGTSPLRTQFNISAIS